MFTLPFHHIYVFSRTSLPKTFFRIYFSFFYFWPGDILLILPNVNGLKENTNL